MDLRFEPEYKPDAIECMLLSALVRMPGFPVEQKLMKSVVDQFLVEARNADTGNANDCQEKLRRAQVAAQIFQMFVDKINAYVTAYTLSESANNSEQRLPDPTQDILDMGGISADLDGVENLFDMSGFEEN